MILPIQSIQPVGDSAVLITFATDIDEQSNTHIISLSNQVEKSLFPYIKESVPAFTTITVYYDSYNICYEDIRVMLLNSLSETSTSVKQPCRKIIIPTFYGHDLGTDIERVANFNKLTVEEVVFLHTSTAYKIYMMGFLPGFPYLGGLPKQLHTPRLDNPRQLVCKGSVGIAGPQTGIYTLDSPGGWNIIGHSPIEMFMPKAENPFIWKPGDWIQFQSISYNEYELLKKDINNGTFRIETEIR
ncbi:5-oxoprolinase subunit PxpB [Bacillus sp. HMF5848]|uniref:5-oxoprolinase subunit PxpB n=1 Tax=Bacillus sp. HMF5848 TaxID=2495421 RepID=UPI000F780EBF|nr:5-oxoprolinase subunit PxpB [Bacillus sp. HMF5848]RSK26758.1 5-oxoprolinase subunit PxpB [Bacillus sp. HMF5848]